MTSGARATQRRAAKKALTDSASRRRMTEATCDSSVTFSSKPSRSTPAPMPVRPDVLLLVGTTKGLFLIDSTGDLKPPLFIGNSVPIANYDPRSKRMLAGLTDFFWGTGVATSDDLGKTWSKPETP